MKDSFVLAWIDNGVDSASFTVSTLDLLAFEMMTSGRFRSYLRDFCPTSGELVEARNKVAATFLDSTDAEWLFMVDSDMGFAHDTVETLLKHADKYRRPVIGGLCFAQKRDGMKPGNALRFRIIPTLYRFVEQDDEVGFVPMFDYPRDQVLEVSATGAACLLVHRRALEKVREKYGDSWFDRVKHPKQPKPFSEDLSFCVRLQACDIPVAVHTGVRTTHHKGDLYLDEELFDRQQRLAALDSVPAVPAEVA